MDLMQCELCNSWNALPFGRTFELRSGKLKSVDCGNRSPWAGIRFVCDDCLRTIAVWMAISVVVNKFEEDDAKEAKRS